jgi:hypothetical protein
MDANGRAVSHPRLTGQAPDVCLPVPARRCRPFRMNAVSVRGCGTMKTIAGWPWMSLNAVRSERFG